MPQIEAVTFDLDDTLVRYERSPAELLAIAYDRRGVDSLFSVEEYYARFEEFTGRYDSIAEIRAACFAALAAEHGADPDLGRALAATYAEERDHTNVELLPGAARVLDDLAAEYPLALVTNGPPDSQQQKIDAVGLDRWIETTVFAGHDAPPKPDPLPFETAMNTLGTAPENTVHVGNSLDTDVAGATAAGVDSVWLAADDHPAAAEPTYRIDALTALPSVLS